MTEFQPLKPPVLGSDPGSLGFVPVDGGVCAPSGIRVAGVSAGLRAEPGRKDLALFVADGPCVAAGTFTTNRFCAAPVRVSRERVGRGPVRAVIINSGNANAATGEQGLATARQTARIVARELGCDEGEVLVASTGVIGVPLGTERFETGVPAAIAALSRSAQASHDAAEAIMTTDTHPKEVAFEGTLPIGPDGAEVAVRVGGLCKGSGMISPNMATMLAVVVTDAPLEQEAATKALREAVSATFNKVTVDSDTSTNDTVFLLATGKAGGERIDCESPAWPVMAAVIRAACEDLARQIAADGEGSTKLVTVDVMGARSDAEAEVVARSVANSPLVKTCIAGHDANWGRVAAAAGKSGVAFDQSQVDIDFLGVPVCRSGLAVEMDEEDMLRRFEQPRIPIVVNLGQGEGAARIWTCDLTHQYISINADYRS